MLSLVLVALALLLRLLTAASELRLPELALASLRGVGERRLWALGLVEPLVLILVALPLGVLAGVGLSLGLTRAWLAPGLPLPLPTAALVGAVAVFLAAVGVAVLAVGMVLRDTLASQLAGLKRPGTARRTAVLIELILIALAVGLLATKLTGGSPGTPDLTRPRAAGGAGGGGRPRRHARHPAAGPPGESPLGPLAAGLRGRSRARSPSGGHAGDPPGDGGDRGRVCSASGSTTQQPTGGAASPPRPRPPPSSGRRRSPWPRPST